MFNLLLPYYTYIGPFGLETRGGGVEYVDFGRLGIDHGSNIVVPDKRSSERQT